MRIRKALALLLCAALAPASPWARQAEATEEVRADDPVEVVEAVIDEYDAATKEFRKKARAAETEEEYEALYESAYPDPAEYVPRLMAVVDQYPESEAALAALTWVLGSGAEVDMQPAFAALRAYHMESGELGDLCEMFPRTLGLEGERFLREVIERNPHHAVVGKACYSLSGLLGDMLSMHERLNGMEDAELEWYTQTYGVEYLKYVHALDPTRVRQERIALLEKVVAEFGDVKVRRSSLAEIAGGELFDLQHLQIGMLAPEIEGEDLDGVSFKLSDYRGKVIFLDFWGDW